MEEKERRYSTYHILYSHIILYSHMIIILYTFCYIIISYNEFNRV